MFETFQSSLVMLTTLSLCLPSQIMGNSSGNKQTTINIVVSVPFRRPYIFRKELVEPAIEFAVASVQQKMPKNLQNHNFVVTYRNSSCSRKAALETVEIYYDHIAKDETTGTFNLTSPMLFLGPVCNDATSVVATFAEYWNVPIISTGAHVMWVSPSAEEYRTLTRITASFFDLGFFIYDALTELHMDQFSSVYLIYEDVVKTRTTEQECYHMMQAINTVLKHKNYALNVIGEGISAADFNSDEFVKRLQSPEVVIMCASEETVRKIMLSAWYSGNAIKGVNSWYTIDLHNDSHYAHGGWKQDDKYDSFAKTAYQALKIFTLRISKTKKFINFSQTMENKYRQAGVKNGKVNSYIEGFHDAVLLYVQALSKTLKEGASLLDGQAVCKNMRNVTFEGIAGPVSIDKYGDRFGDYSLLAMNDAIEGTYKKLLDYFSKERQSILYKWPTFQSKLPEWLNGDSRRNLAPPTEPNDFDHKAIAGTLGALAGLVASCVLICLPIFYRKKRSSALSNDDVINNQEQLHIPLREEVSVTTCMSSLEDDRV